MGFAFFQNKFIVSDGVLTKYNGSSANVAIPRHVTAIGDHAFSENTAIVSVTIPEGVTSIGDFAFAGCTSLQTVSLPRSLRHIGKYAFTFCAIREISVPEGVTCLSYGVFDECSSLTRLSLPSTLTSVESWPFLKNLSELSLYDSITTQPGIGYIVALKKIVLHCKKGDPIYYLANVHIYSSETTIVEVHEDQRTFSYRPGDFVINGRTLTGYRGKSTRVVIPDYIESIGPYAFSKLPVVSVSLPVTIKSIGNGAFV